MPVCVEASNGKQASVVCHMQAIRHCDLRAEASTACTRGTALRPTVLVRFLVSGSTKLRLLLYPPKAIIRASCP